MEEEKSLGQKIVHYRREIIIGLLIILLIAFMVDNSHDVDFNLVFTDMSVPLIVLILGFACLGAMIVGLYWFIGSRDNKRDRKLLQKENKQLREKIAQLENQRGAERA